jgi:hypothetical protein
VLSDLGWPGEREIRERECEQEDMLTVPVVDGDDAVAGVAVREREKNMKTKPALMRGKAHP